LPAHFIDRAIDECSNTFTSMFEKTKLTGQRCTIKYKNKQKSIIETITVEAGMISKSRNTILKTFIGKVKSSEDFYQPKHMCKLQYNRHTKDWFLIFNKDVNIRPHEHPFDIVSIDPGEKIFLDLYSPDKGGHVFSICEDNRKGKIFYLLKHLDALTSKRSLETKKRRKKSLSRAIHRINKKIQNMRNDMHHKTSLFICKNYKNIVIPKYESKQMVSNLNTEVCRSISSLSFYKFKQMLKYKSFLYGCNYFEVDEILTTKTCGVCGTYNIPKDRVYLCMNCKVEIHRDHNAARNILLKHL